MHWHKVAFGLVGLAVLAGAIALPFLLKGADAAGVLLALALAWGVGYLAGRD